MRDNLADVLSSIKVAEMLQKKEDTTEKKVLWIFAVIGAVVAVAGIAYGVYRYLTPDYLEDFDEDFDEDFYDELEELEKEEAKEEEEAKNDPELDK